MLINNRQATIIYLNRLIGNIFKIMPLYEEKNDGLNQYVESLILRLRGLEKVIDLGLSYEYITLLSILESLNDEIKKESCVHKTVRKSSLKSIDMIKTMIQKLEGECHE